MSSADFSLTPVEKVIRRRKRTIEIKNESKKEPPNDFTLTPIEKIDKRRKHPTEIKDDRKIESLGDKSEVNKIIQDMGANHFGAFCEYVMARELVAKGYSVVKSHGELKDLMVNGVRTDVKGHRYLTKDKSHHHVYPHKVPLTNYIHIVFLKDKAVYYDEDNRITSELSYQELSEYWERWPYDRKHRSTETNSLKKRRNYAKKEFTNKLSRALGYPVYVVQRGSEITRGERHFQKGPDNLSLDNIRRSEKMMVYLQFKDNSVDFDRAVAFMVEDVKNKRFPMTLSWGRLDKISKEIVVTEEMWDRKEDYPTVYFGEEMDLEKTIEGIVKKFY